MLSFPSALGLTGGHRHHRTRRLDASKARCAGADGIGDIARRQMAVMPLDHPGVGMPEVLCTTINGTPFIAAKLAQVWRSAWKLTDGVIRAQAQAARIGRA
jgi:hypothetical protein